MTVEEACIVLGIEKPNISEEELKHRFYDAAHLSHPDNNPYNEYAKTKFAMIQEAYLVLKGYIFEMPIDQSVGTEQDSNKNTTSFHNRASGKNTAVNNEKSSWDAYDPWDAYNEADCKFERMRKEQAKKKAREAFARKEAADQRYAAYMNSQKVDNDTIVVDSNPDKEQICTEPAFKLRYELFMKKDLLFDSLLALFVAVFMVCTVLNVSFVMAVFAWGIAILIGRRAGKLVFEQKGNVFLSLLMLLISTEILMILFKVFLL